MIFYPLKKTAYLQEGIYQDQLVFNSLICVSIVIEVFWFCQNKTEKPTTSLAQMAGFSVLWMRSFSGTVDSSESHRGGGINLGAEWSSSTPFTSKEEAGSKMKIIFPQTASYSDVFLLQRNNTGIKTKPSALPPRSKHCSQLFIQQKSSSKQSLYVGAAIPTPEPPNIQHKFPRGAAKQRQPGVPPRTPAATLQGWGTLAQTPSTNVA